MAESKNMRYTSSGVWPALNELGEALHAQNFLALLLEHARRGQVEERDEQAHQGVETGEKGVEQQKGVLGGRGHQRGAQAWVRRK